MSNQHRIICPYCGEPAKQVTGETIYPHKPDLSDRIFYLCKPCNAYVGCHKSGNQPLALANEELRSLRSKCHSVFDKTWRDKGISRFVAYKKLAEKMNVAERYCHIGKFNIEQCQDLLLLFRGK